jgi:hypothetical protein
MPSNTRLKGSNDWGATAYWSAGTAPADGEDLFVNDGADTFTAGISRPGDDLLSLTVTPGFSGNGGAGGASASYMVFDVDQTNTGVLDYNGNGDWWHQKGGTGGGIYKIVVRPIKRTMHFNLLDADNDILEVENGVVYVGTDATLVDVLFTGGEGVIDTNGSDTIDEIYVNNARVTLKRDFTTAGVGAGGVLYWDGAGITGGNVALDGGTLVWLDGNLGNVTGRGGVLDLRQLKKDVTGSTFRAGRSLTYARSNTPSADVTFSATDPIASGPQTAA